MTDYYFKVTVKKEQITRQNYVQLQIQYKMVTSIYVKVIGNDVIWTCGKCRKIKKEKGSAGKRRKDKIFCSFRMKSGGSLLIYISVERSLWIENKKKRRYERKEKDIWTDLQ